MKTFKELYELDIKNMVEQVEISASRKLSYLSWANAVKLATEIDENFTFEFIVNENDGSYLFPQSVKKMQIVRMERVVETTEFVPVVVVLDGVETTKYEKKNVKQITSEDVMQEIELKTTYMVKTRCILNGVVRTMSLPVMDNKNNAVGSPDARDVNDSLMRCLAKNIALYGIGLALYTGEDLEKFVTKDLKQVLKETVMKKYDKNNETVINIFRNFSNLHNKMVKDFSEEELKELNGALEQAGY